MVEDKFDAIIVGGGLAGSAAAYTLAKEGLEVLVIERGNYSGSKNMTGGRLYVHSLEKLMPDFAQSAPVERRVRAERLSVLTADGGVTAELDNGGNPAEALESYTVLRATFDRWLAEQAEEEGAMFVYGIRVDDLMMRDGKVCGVVAGDEEMEADLVILADGVHSLLAQKLGLKKPLRPEQALVGVKELFTLPAAVIEERFGVAPGEGVAWLLGGDPTMGQRGEAFLYTNKDSISLGLVTSVDDLGTTELAMSKIMDRVASHPVIAPLLEGAQLAEYSAHLIPVTGLDGLPQLCADGLLLAGDAAGLVIHKGCVVRGMDLAIESGRLAAEAVLGARERGDFSQESLSTYRKALAESFIFKDMARYEAMAEPEHAAAGDELKAALTAELAALYEGV